MVSRENKVKKVQLVMMEKMVLVVNRVKLVLLVILVKEVKLVYEVNGVYLEKMEIRDKPALVEMTDFVVKGGLMVIQVLMEPLVLKEQLDTLALKVKLENKVSLVAKVNRVSLVKRENKGVKVNLELMERMEKLLSKVILV